MALNINGTTGISGVDGSASAPALQGTDSNTGINFASDTVNINTGGTTRATVDSAGQVGMGTSSPAQQAGRGLHINGTDQARLKLTNASSGATANDGFDIIVEDGLDTHILNHENGNLKLGTNNAERIRVDSAGRVGIGTTTTNNPDIADGGLQIRPNHSTGAPDVHFTRASSSGTSNVVGFVNGNVGVGSIAYNGSATAFNTSSDYRLKENINAISDGITRLKTLKPSRFNFIHDETNTLCDGFIAHEVSPIVPEAITGEKDAVDSDNNPVYQGIDQAKLVPLLTAALQEAIAKIETLETKVAALEAG